MSELRAVVAFNGNEIDVRIAVAQLFDGLIFRRAITRQRDIVARKFDDNSAPARFAFSDLISATANQISASEPAKRCIEVFGIDLVARWAGHIDMRDPV